MTTCPIKIYEDELYPINVSLDAWASGYRRCDLPSDPRAPHALCRWHYLKYVTKGAAIFALANMNLVRAAQLNSTDRDHFINPF